MSHIIRVIVGVVLGVLVASPILGGVIPLLPGLLMFGFTAMMILGVSNYFITVKKRTMKPLKFSSLFHHLKITENSFLPILIIGLALLANFDKIINMFAHGFPLLVVYILTLIAVWEVLRFLIIMKKGIEIPHFDTILKYAW